MLRHGGAVCQGVKNDLLPQVILISPSLIQQDQSARKTIKSSMVLVVTSVPETPIGPKKPEVFLVPELALDGSSLCMECDVIVHAGGKRSHERYLLLRQKIEVQALHLDYQLIGKVRISAWANTIEPLKRKNQFKK